MTEQSKPLVPARPEALFAPEPDIVDEWAHGTEGTLAARIIGGLHRFRVTQGAGAGKPFQSLPWQRRFLRGALRRGVSRAALSVARGNGKTTLVAAIATAALAGPMRRPRGEVIIVASSFAQAKIAFDHSRAFLQPALEQNPARWRIQDSQNVGTLEDRHTGARLRVIGSDPRRAHGLAPALVIADEPAQWPPGTAHAMHAALMTGLGKIEDSRLWAIGTQPADSEHFFRRMFGPDGCDYAQLHMAPPEAPPLHARTWARANPSLAIMPALRAQIAREARAAANDPGLLAAFRALRLNAGEHETARAMLVDADLWKAIEGEPPAAMSAPVWGVDLGGTAAFSAIACYDPAGGGLDAVAMIGDDPPPKARGLRDGVGRLYQDLVEEGTLVLSRGRTVPVPQLLEHALARFGRPSALAADRWREGELADALRAARFPAAAIQWRGQGFKDGGEDVREFRRACADRRVTPRRTRLLRAAMSEAVTISDPAGNAKLAKGGEGARRVRARDDVAAAAILAVALGRRRGATRRPRYRGLA